jgi:hypothetical protein
MTEYDDVLHPENKLKAEDDEFTADNITATLKISRQELTDAMQTLHKLTNADKFSTAVNLVWYKIDPKDRQTNEQMSMITTLYRCTLDGTVKPPVDLDEYYREVNGLSNTTGNKPNM